jgi:hypothetical protein
VNTTGWLKGLRVTADGSGIVSHTSALPVLMGVDLVSHGDYTRPMARYSGERRPAPQRQEAEESPRAYPLNESGHEEAKRPRRRGGVRTIGKAAGVVVKVILEVLPF